MDKVYQVFVSSTYSDLKDERRRVSEFLAKDGFIPAGMELFPASDQQQLEFIKRVIDRCDYYVVILGGRYGSLADDHVSFTEKEYEYALAKGIPVLAFLHIAPDSLEVRKTDKDKSKEAKLQSFRERLSRGRMVDYWENSYELCAKIVIAVGQASTLFPGVGWVRGDQAIDPKVLQETERLRIENVELKTRLLQLNQTDLTFPADLLGPDEEFDFKIFVTHYQPGPRYPRTKIGSHEISFSIRIGDLYLRIYDHLLKGISESKLPSILGTLLANVAGQQEHGNASSTYVCATTDVQRLRFQLEALGLIVAAGDRTAEGSRFISWAITEKGRRYAAQFRAVKRKD